MKRILNEGRAIIESVMQLDGLLGPLPLLRMAAHLSMLAGRLVKSGSSNLSPRGDRMVRVPLGGQH